jgi:hypothetical protein
VLRVRVCWTVNTQTHEGGNLSHTGSIQAEIRNKTRSTAVYFFANMQAYVGRVAYDVGRCAGSPLRAGESTTCNGDHPVVLPSGALTAGGALIVSHQFADSTVLSPLIHVPGGGRH